MILLKILAAGLTVLAHELAQWAAHILLALGMDEVLFRRFRRAVKRSYGGCCDMHVCASLKALRQHKRNLLEAETAYREACALIGSDLLAYEQLRLCDEREAVEQAVESTERLAALLLTSVFENAQPCCGWAARDVVAHRLPAIWREWCPGELPIEIFRVLEDAERHIEHSKRLLAGLPHDELE